MNLVKNSTTLIAVMLLMTAVAFSQTTESKKEIVIETVTIDKDGKEVKETIRLEGKDAEAYMKKHHGKMGDHHIDIRIDREGDENSDDDGNVFIFKSNDGELEVIGHGDLHEGHSNISVNVDDNNGKIKIEVKKDGMESFVWEGEGEIPQDIKDMLKEKYGVDLDAEHGGEGTEIEKVIRIERSSNSNKARLGVMLRGESEQEGVIVDGVMDDSAAEKAGLEEGDVITHINGIAMKGVEQLVKEIGTLGVGDVVDIQFTRDGNSQEVKATLEENKNQMQWTTENDGLLNFDINDKDIRILMEEGADGKKVITKKKMIIIEERKKDQEKKIEKLNAKPSLQNNILDLPEFNVYPNPSEGQISIDFTAKALPTTISITDITGKEVYREELNGFDGQYKKQINLAKAAKGAMLLTIQQGDKIFTEKLINQ